MANVLLVFPFNIVNNSEFEKIIHEFDEKGYIIHVFDEINKEIPLDSLPGIIDFAKSQLREEINRLVILSNLRDLIFSWFRCYNSIVNDFIYYIDQNYSIFSDTFAQQLAGFNDIEREYLEGKIYINLYLDNCRHLFMFLLTEGNFRYFTPFYHFNFQANSEKKKIYKKYQYQNHFFEFKIDGYQKSNIIDIQNRINNNLNIEFKLNDRLQELLIENHYFITSVAKAE